MEDVARTEYPAMLAYLQPSQAVLTLNDRHRRMAKINSEIADWLQERRRVEEQYVQGMRKLVQFKVPNAQSELGVFQAPWDRILRSVDSAAQTHHLFAERLERDVETPIRQLSSGKEMQNVQTISTNMSAMARELEDSLDRVDRLQRKPTRATAQKSDAANTRLDAAAQAWDSQAPYIFETLQALDESRVDHMRDLLTQMLTHEADAAQRRGEIVAEVLAGLIEVQTAEEVRAFAAKVVAGKPKVERRGGAGAGAGSGAGAGTLGRQGHGQGEGMGAAGLGPGTRSGTATGNGSAAASLTVSSPGGGSGAGTAGTGDEDVISDQASVRDEPKNESRLRRLGTMLGRRRQSVHGGFGQISGFTRNIGSSHGRLSPRASSNNLSDPHRLSSLAETPDSPTEPSQLQQQQHQQHQQSSTVHHHSAAAALGGPNPPQDSYPFPASQTSTGPGRANGIVDPSIFDMQPPFDVPPTQQQSAEPTKDSEGYTIPPPVALDPISQAQREAAAEDADQGFKVSIQSTPLAEEDPDATQAAISNVASTLSQMALPLPGRKAGTVRGRRDVRNTICLPPQSSLNDGNGSSSTTDNNPFLSFASMPPPLPPLPLPPSMPASPSTISKLHGIASLASETSAAGTSDSQSVRSGNSLGSGMAHLRHPDPTAPGLNASVIETVSATFDDGAITSVSVLGEIAFSYGGTGVTGSPVMDGIDGHETIRINNMANLGSVGPNRILVQNTSTTSPDRFTLDTSHLGRGGGAATAFSYRVFSDTPSTPTPTTTSFAQSAEISSLSRHVPLLLRPVWKPDGDKLGLLLQYGPNPGWILAGPVTLRNVVIIASYVGGRASRAQTKPSGTHLGDKGLVYWRIGDLTMDSAAAVGSGDHKIVCRVIGADSSGVELRPGHVEARWEYAPAPAADGGLVEAVASGISISRLAAGPEDGDDGDGGGGGDRDPATADEDEDPFADADPSSPGLASSFKKSKRWIQVPLARKLVSGRYESRPAGASRPAVPSTPSTTTTGIMGSPTGIPASA